MLEVQGITVKLLPIIFKHQRLQLLELLRSRIRSKNLEIRVCCVEFTSETYQVFNTFFCVIEKTDYIKGRGSDTQFPAQPDHLVHVLVGNKTAGNLLEN